MYKRQNTDPAETIHALTGSPFLVNNQLVRIGTFTFTCMSGCGAVVTETEDPRVVPQEFAVGSPFPNPAQDQVSIPVTPGDASTIQIEMTNALGQSISYSAPVNPGQREQIVRVPVNNLASGVWVIRVSGRDHIASSRVILAR